MKVTADKLSDAIASSLTRYGAEITKGVKRETAAVAKEMLSRIREAAPKRHGKYRRAMKIKTEAEDPWSLTKLWYVAAPHYRLTHLLERGHAKRNGKGTVRAYEHIKPGEEWAMGELERRVKGVIGDASK